MVSLQEAAERFGKECMAVRKGERVLVITDENKLEIGEAIAVESRKITQTKLLEIDIGKQHGEEPPKLVAKIMKEHDIIIIPTTKSLSHTKARREANDAGARIATLPGITKGMIKRCIDIDYNKLNEVHDKIINLLRNSRQVKIITGLGTKIMISVRNTKGKPAGLLHNKGDFDNLPTGEVDSGVKEAATNGKIVVDASFGGLGKLDSPIKLTVKDGYVVSVKGEKAEKLKSLLDSVGEKAYKIAELGIGTNPKAVVSGNTLEDEKVLGTVHFAVGNDMTYGGKNDVPIHLDGIMTKPTIYIDGKKIMEKGKLMI